MSALDEWLILTSDQLETGGETTALQLDSLNQSLVTAIRTEFGYYGKSDILSGIVNTTNWSQGVSYTIDDIPEGEYELVFSLAADFLAISYVLEWRVTGTLDKGPYSEGGLALPGTMARSYSYPVVHGGGTLIVGIEMRIPQTGFNIEVEEAFFTLKRVKGA